MGKDAQALPPGFDSIRDILDGSIQVGRLANVVGLVKDLRAPMPTNRTDYKSSLTLYDKSTEDDGYGLTLNIFRPPGEMPSPAAGDCVVICNAKVQDYGGISLLTSWQTGIHVYAGQQIPEPPNSASVAMHPPSRLKSRLPSEQENAYVSWLYHNIDKTVLPDEADFRVQVEQSLNKREKFSTLDNVQDHRFYDVIVQVVKEPFDEMDKVNMWVSDYTENEGFYNHSWKGPTDSGGRDGDPYGYTASKVGHPPDWAGPFGKRSLQVTCWGAHAEILRHQVKRGDWLRLRNLHVKFGRNGLNLDGALHEERGVGGGRLQVELLDTEDTDNIDERLKNAIRRKRDYEKLKKQQQKSYTDNANGIGAKRKSDEGDPPRQNAKTKRAQKRAAARANEQELERRKQTESQQGLSEHIKSDNQDVPVTSISSILQRIPWTTKVDGSEVTIPLPFVCARYRTNVRVVGYQPQKLEDFTSWRKNTEYDMLSDNSANSDSESSGDDDAGTLEAYRGRKTWDWRFALQLEEVDPEATTKDGARPERLWAVVENTEAQLLLGLDACDLRADQDALADLRERLFVLWGDLEERKLAELERRQQNNQKPGPRGANALQPPPDSSPFDGGGGVGDSATSAVSNKSFTCCLQQYGVRMPEKNPSKADAGDGYRWERMFGVFGTKIAG